MLLAMKSDRGQISCRKDGYLFVLSRSYAGVPIATDGTEAELMITGQLGSHPTGFVVEPVTADHVLVTHDGFECAGSMCCTTAHSRQIGMMTPGRVQKLLIVAENATVGWNGRKAQPRTPGAVYVRKGEHRATGIPDISFVNTVQAKENAEFKKAYQAVTAANRAHAKQTADLKKADKARNAANRANAAF